MDLTFVITTCKDHIKFLNRCISSLPSNKNYNLFIIIDEKNIKYKRLVTKLLQKKNFINFNVYLNFKKGISSSRNQGIRLCVTKWITFIDGDDYLYNKKLKLNSLNENFDFMIYNSQLSNKKPTEFYVKKTQIQTSTQKSNLIKKYLSFPKGNSLVTHAWSKIYNLNFLKKNKILFKNKLNVNEDLLFNTECFLKAKKIKLFQKIKFVYHNVSNSKKTRLRHLNTNKDNYEKPMKILAKLIPKKNRNQYQKKAIEYWENKIKFLSKI